MGAGLLIRDAELPIGRRDLRCAGDRIVEVETRLSASSGEDELDAEGGALLPGLHDHHLHLLSLAAALESVECGPPQIRNAEALRRRLATGEPGAGWLRGTGYFESVAGPLDRDVLDRLCPDRPLRIQHRSGAMWFLNSPAIEALGLDRAPTPAGVERDPKGRATGRLFRLDEWLRARLPERTAPNLARVGRLLARRGVTGVTDATPENGRAEIGLLRAAQASGALPQQLLVMGGHALAEEQSDARLAIGPLKILLDEPALPDLEELIARIRRAHASARAVAIHCVTRSEILFALAAIESAGPREGDRLEHASVAPDEAVEGARRLGITVVTQPNFVAERGEAYRTEVDPVDLGALYRARGWLEAGVPLAAGSDAPFGRPDPWSAMRAAVERRCDSGHVLGPEERLEPEQALALFAGTLGAPGGAPRRVQVGARADLCLLDAGWQEVRQDLRAERVRATIASGQLIWPRPAG